jgi:hypothetical protein
MDAEGTLGVRRVCCLLHNLIPGGSARQWIHLLGGHVARGGEATIIAPPGKLDGLAEAAGIRLVPHHWDNHTPLGCERLWPIVSRHDVAIVHWDHQVMRAFEPALQACGRAALVLHQAPHALDWLGPEVFGEARAILESALGRRRAVVLVRGESHRRRVAAAFAVEERKLRILPASIPRPPLPRHQAADQPNEVLALMRLSPEKAAIAHLAVELVRARHAGGRNCRLVIAGEGPWREDAVALCKRQLPAGSWRVEEAPRDPIARLADADLVVAQGLTTLEAAALGRRVVVARGRESGAAGTALSPELYDVAARDPFGQPPLTQGAEDLWAQILAVDRGHLQALRELVERHNSLEVASRALAEALAATGRWPQRLAARLQA